jgi:hypothetical protein
MLGLARFVWQCSTSRISRFSFRFHDFSTMPKERCGNSELDFVRDLFPVTGVVGGGGGDVFGLG